jgi:hypothetical protein
MDDTALGPDRELTEAISRDGFSFVAAATMRAALVRCGTLADWPGFAASWHGLELDPHMADHGRYRRRRYAVYALAADGAIARQPHQPHYQSRDYNPLNGGVARWFTPVSAEIGDGQSMRTILEFCRRLFGGLAARTGAWHVEIHQLRIEAWPGEQGLPTPEGLHRDGVDYVLVLLVARHNIASGTTTIHALDRSLLGSFTLAAPFDAALVDDSRVYHGVTAVTPLDPAAAAHRDVLVVTFRKA